MKPSVILICLNVFCISCLVSAQTSEISKADSYINNFKYINAAEIYSEQILHNETASKNQTIEKLADLYFKMNKFDEALKYYELTLSSNLDSISHYNYAQTLRQKGNNDAYHQQMEAYLVRFPKDPKASIYRENLKAYDNKRSNVSLTSLETNTAFTEFGGIILNDKVYFSTNRKGRKYNRINEMTGEPFTKIYQADLKDKNLTNIKEVFDLSSRTNDGLVCFNKSFTRAYFSSSTININDYVSRKEKFKSKNYSLEQLFIAKKSEKGFWTEYRALPFCKTEYVYLNPFLSPDGKHLYFVSNMEGTLGGLDIWRVEILSENAYGNPENLGSSINTILDENCPFLKEDNQTFLFSSQGHVGIGGYDIYEYDLSNKQEKPINIGIPFNSPQDDIAFFYYDEQQLGFLSSNRNGNLDIFKVESPKEEYFELKLIDPTTNTPLSNIDVLILDTDGNLLKTLKSDQNGLVYDKVPFQKNYIIKVQNESFEPLVTNVKNSYKGLESQTFSLTKKPEVAKEEEAQKEILLYKTNTILFAFNKYEITIESKLQLDNIVELLNNDEQIKLEIISHSDARGSESYNLKLSEKRAIAAKNYLISKLINKNRISIKPMGESQPLINCGNNCSEEEFAQNRRNEFVVILSNGQRFISE